MISTVEELHLESFSMGDLCKATGLSRTAIIKLENMGLIKPHSVDEKTGYRSYTLFEIANVIQYRLLRDMDISQDEILDYFTHREHLDLMIEKMKIRKNLMQRAIEELELRKRTEEKYSFSYIDLPDIKCYCGKEKFITPGDVEKFTAKLVEEAVKLGFTRLSYEPLFSLRWNTDTQIEGDPNTPFEATVCVPIEPNIIVDKDLPEDRIGHIENVCGGRAFSLLYHGGYETPDYFNPVFARFWEEIMDRKIRIIEPVRGIGIVCSYVGLDINPSDYVFRFAALIDES